MRNVFKSSPPKNGSSLFYNRTTIPLQKHSSTSLKFKIVFYFILNSHQKQIFPDNFPATNLKRAKKQNTAKAPSFYDPTGALYAPFKLGYFPTNVEKLCCIIELLNGIRYSEFERSRYTERGFIKASRDVCCRTRPIIKTDWRYGTFVNK